MAGLWASISTILGNVHAWATTAIGGGIWGHGGVASDGANMFVVRETRLTLAAIGWAAKQSYGCKPVRSGAVSPPTTGHQQTGWISIIATPISVVSAPR